MGKKRHHGAAYSNQRKPTGVPSSLVVVNPMLLQSVGQSTASITKKPQPSAKSKFKNKQKPKRSQRDDEDHTAAPIQKKQKHKNRTAASTSATIVSITSPAQHTVLAVKNESQSVAGIYWLLMARATKRSCVVVLPNQSITKEISGGSMLTPQQLAAALKNLGFQAVSVHKKMTPGQRQDNIDRLVKSCAASTISVDASHVVLVTTEHFAPSCACLQADLLLLLNLSAIPTTGPGLPPYFTKFLYTYIVHTTPNAYNGTTFTPEMSNTVAQHLQSRLKLAFQIADISQRLGTMSSDDVDSKWANKFAKGADLDDEDDETARKQKKNTKKQLTPDEQRLQALTEKLTLLLARKIETDQDKSKQLVATNKGAEKVDGQNRTEKLELLGLVTMNASVGSSVNEERLSAQTQWLDRADGKPFGGDWDGSVRHGASKDSVSLKLRQKYCACLKKKSKTNQLESHGNYLRYWQPNKQPSDLEKWGGEYGKVCGHNEVVMQFLRPFYPQEVLNSKVCSKVFPAPGNQGFDGCLEHLRLTCVEGKSAMTVWDAESFIYITTTGKVTWTKKAQLLGLPLSGLQCLMTNLRSWTLACKGRIAPKEIVAAIHLCCLLGCGEQQAGNAQEMKVMKKIMMFALGGSMRAWKQIAKLPCPLEDEVVYPDIGKVCF